MSRERNGIMLAHPLEHSRLDKFPSVFFVQPKLNGVRCVAKPKGLFSSTMKEKPYLHHIKEALKHLPNFQYDGELYVHGKSWAEINSIASRTENKHLQEEILEYHIFDVLLIDDQNERARVLKQLGDHLSTIMGNTFPIKIVETNRTTREDLGYWVTYHTKRGYEGVICRDPKGWYEKKRSKYLLKFKPTLTDIYQIVDCIQGEGWCYDRLGSFRVRSKDGTEFGIGTGALLTADGRASIWSRRKEVIGKYLLVKHEYLTTENNLPQCAVALEILTDEGVEAYRKAKHDDLV